MNTTEEFSRPNPCTLQVTKISYGYGYADVIYCEVDDVTGARDGFVEDRLVFDPLASESEQKEDVDSQLKEIAAKRGIDY